MALYPHALQSSILAPHLQTFQPSDRPGWVAVVIAVANEVAVAERELESTSGACSARKASAKRSFNRGHSLARDPSTRFR